LQNAKQKTNFPSGQNILRPDLGSCTVQEPKSGLRIFLLTREVAFRCSVHSRVSALDFFSKLNFKVCLLRWAYCQGDSRLPAECRGNTGEADDAEPENLDSGPQVLSNLLRKRQQAHGERHTCAWRLVFSLLVG
jgi:hypothetical protein